MGLNICLMIIWSGFCLAALALAATESMGSWQLAGPQNADRRIYFSPSCPACRDAVTAFANSAAFIPVAEKDSDNAVVYAMHQAIEKGSTLVEALEAVMRATENGTLPEPPFPDAVTIRLKLLRNKVEVLRLGVDTLPLILIKGMPRTPPPDNGAGTGRTASPYGGGVSRNPASLPPELTAPVDSCGDSNREPCDPPR